MSRLLRELPKELAEYALLDLISKVRSASKETSDDGGHAHGTTSESQDGHVAVASMQELRRLANDEETQRDTSEQANDRM